jgi:hypothetical protein
MTAQRGIVRGDLVLDDDLDLYGTVLGNVTVDRGHTLRLYGTIRGNLEVLEHGAAFVYGTVTGDTSAAGHTEVYGVIYGAANGPGLTLQGGAVGRHSTHAAPLARVESPTSVGTILAISLLPWAALRFGPYHIHGMLHRILTPDNAIAVAACYVVFVLMIIYDVEEWTSRKLFRSAAVIAGLTYGFVGVWATIYQQVAFEHPTGTSQCFTAGHLGSTNGFLSRIDSIYYAVGQFSTAGSGSLQPLSSECRYLAMLQMALDATLILLGASALVVRLLQPARR